MKGFQSYKTKAQDLVEIRESQNGFLGGLNLDAPRSDVGDTQVTTLNNMIPFRDRLEARGGIKPSVDYLFNVADNATTFTESSESAYYDDEWDEIFSIDQTAAVKMTGTKSLTSVFNGGGLLSFLTPTFKRVNDKLLLSDDNNIAIIEDRGSDYFLRPVTSDPNPSSEFPPLSAAPASGTAYVYNFSYIRKIDGVVLSESLLQGQSVRIIVGTFNDVITPVSVSTNITNSLPQNMFTVGGSDNFFTHIRFYRSISLGDFDAGVAYNPTEIYAVGDQTLVSATVPANTYLNLNVSDGLLTSSLVTHPIAWQGGYAEILPNRLFEVSSAMLLVKNSESELVYSPISSGDDQKYLGWYNPFFQFSKGINGDVTSLTDIGSAILITTANRSYYIDTINKSEDAGQQGVGIYTPILSDVVTLSYNIGVNENQRLALVNSKEGKLIGLTSDGAIREFSGYNWGAADLSRNKIHAITKGIILNENLACDAAFADDAYYLNYYRMEGSNYVQHTIRMGTTEEAGYGFSLFTGKPEVEGDIANQKGWPYSSTPNFNGDKNSMLLIKGKLFVIRRQNEVGGNPDSSFGILHEYTGDKFDKKINKDAVDLYSETANLPVYSSTTYFDITTEVEFPEVTAAQESAFLYFLKANFNLRADRFTFKVTNEGSVRAYNIVDTDLTPVSLSDVTFGMDARKGESDDIVAFNNGFVPTSAVTLQRDVQDHRIRLSLRGNGAGFRLTGIDFIFNRHNRTELDDTTTGNNTIGLTTGMYTWINHNLTNLSVGRGRLSTFDIGAPIEGAFIGPSPLPEVTGNIASIVTGPDGQLTGMQLNAQTYYEFQAPSVPDPVSATIMFWSDISTDTILQTGYNPELGDTYIFAGDNSGVLIITEMNNEVITTYNTGVTMTSGFHHYAFVHNATAWLLYVDGVLSFTSSANTLLSWIKSPSILVGGENALTLSDIRMYNKIITQEEITFYINNVLNNEGDYVNGY